MRGFFRAVVAFHSEELFKPETRLHEKLVQELVVRNNQIQGVHAICFSYLGVNYGQMVYGAPNPILAAELIPTMRDHLAYRKQVLLDKNLISQVLFKLLRDCENVQDVRNALPECLAVQDSPMVTNYARTAEAAWTLRLPDCDPRSLRQYEKALPKIEMYCGLKYIY